MGPSSVFGLALAIAIFGVVANHAREMYRDKKYREMFGTLFWAFVPIAMFSLFWIANENPSIMMRNITLGFIGAVLGASALIWAGYVWRSSVAKANPDADFIYFSADMENGGPTGWPLVLSNNSFKPFSGVDSWFAPAKSKPGEEAYLALRSLKVVAPGPVHHGGFWTGKVIPAGQYRVEYHGFQDGISYAFVEFLQLRAAENDRSAVQLIDVWKMGPSERTKVFSSPRASQADNIDDPDEFVR
jgi:hypothetical protein